MLRNIVSDFVKYMNEMKDILIGHLNVEYEVQLREGLVTKESQDIISKLREDFVLLQYDHKIQMIIEENRDKYLMKKPRLKNITDFLHDLLNVVYDDLLFEARKLVYKVQQQTLQNRRQKNNILCSLKCKKTIVTNFTTVVLSKTLIRTLENGMSFVPKLNPDLSKLKLNLITEAISACKSLFKDAVGYYPRVSVNNKLDDAIIQMISQSKCNSNLVNQMIKFRDSFTESFPMFLSSLPDNRTLVQDLIRLNPDGCVITVSDKNVGISVLPIDWYSKEYKAQIQKGGHILINKTEPECLALLYRAIQEFKESCNAEQTRLLNTNWPREPRNHRIGIMKLVPKVHKLSGIITSESWKTLPSRPIRGAELDPINSPSRVLYSLLNNIISKFKILYENHRGMIPYDFPVIKGCDEYSKRVQQLRLKASQMMMTTFISADFGDAYTETGISSLQESIRLIGDLIGVENFEIDLMIKLVHLVFSNCYFYTPYGLYRQTRGMPMGDYSSR